MNNEIKITDFDEFWFEDNGDMFEIWVKRTPNLCVTITVDRDVFLREVTRTITSELTVAKGV